MTLASITKIIDEISIGRMIIMVDADTRENEGDLIIAADYINPSAINFMTKYGRGLVCLSLTEKHCNQLGLRLVTDFVPQNHKNKANEGQENKEYRANFTFSIEAASGVTTGVSAADRAHTIQMAVNPNAKPENIIQPGHVFPLMAKNGGVLVRAGHTETGCDLARLAGCFPAAVICEIMAEDGSMARMPDLIKFANQHGLLIGSIAQLIEHLK